MSLHRTASSHATAILAAYVLVLQVLFAGLGAGLAAGSTLSGAPQICRGAGPQMPDGEAGHRADACCLAGCAGAGLLLAPPPATSALAAPPRGRLAMGPERRAAHPRGNLHTRYRARAPPA